MCKALVNVANSQDKSRALLETLTASLSTVYSPYEATSVNASRVCSIALAKSASLASFGYLQGLRPGSLQLADLISSFVIPRDAVLSPDVLKMQYRINIAVRTCGTCNSPAVCGTSTAHLSQHNTLSVMTDGTTGGESSGGHSTRDGLRAVPRHSSSP
jgi:hypothetical protein